MIKSHLLGRLGGPMAGLVLSLFPGIGLLDRAFEELGFCVVRGPDLIWGGDVRRFHPPRGKFDLLIGGPPCQDFSAARRAVNKPTGYGLDMLAEFTRCVSEADPDAWLMENVPEVPEVEVDGYHVQRLNVEQAWYVPIRRSRRFQWGRHARILERSQPLDIPRGTVITPNESCAMASDFRPFRDLCRLQGLPDDFDLTQWSETGKRQAVGNGVGLVLGRVVAAAVAKALGLVSQTTKGPNTVGGELGHSSPAALPRCSVCQGVITGKRRTCSDACRTMLSRRNRGLVSRRGRDGVASR